MTDNKYKEINIGKKVSFEDDAEDKQVTTVELEDLVEQEDTKEVKAPASHEEDKPVVAKTDVKRESRAQKRIKQLHQERQTALAELEAERAEKMELKRQLAEGSKNNKSSLKTQLEDKIKILSQQMAEAIRAGEADLVVGIQDMLTDAKFEYKTLEKEIAATPAVETESPKKQQANTIPDRALEWIADHPEFKTDEDFHVNSIMFNNQLLRDGYDATTDEFYEELDKRLSKRFPELFGITTKSGVESNHTKIASDDDGSDEDEQTDVKQKTVKPSTSKVRTTEQVVSGSSRPSANSGSPKKKFSVDLSPTDVAQADKWGITLEQMARRIAHMESNKDGNGYVPVQIKKS